MCYWLLQGTYYFRVREQQNMNDISNVNCLVNSKFISKN